MERLVTGGWLRKQERDAGVLAKAWYLRMSLGSWVLWEREMPAEGA